MKTIKTIKFKKILLLFFIITVANSCSDEFLEVEPTGVLIAQNTVDYDLMLNRGIGNLGGLGELSYRSFENCALEPHFSKAHPTDDPGRNNFTWEPGIYNEGEDIMYFAHGNGFMSQLYILNKIVNEVLKSIKNMYFIDYLCIMTD